MKKDIYSEVEKAFKSMIIYYQMMDNGYKIKTNVDYTKVNTLEELLTIYNNEKKEYEDWYAENYDSDFIVDFLQYYAQKYHIFEYSKGDMNLYFSILFGFLLEIHSSQGEIRKYRLKIKTGEIEDRCEEMRIQLKGDKCEEVYRKLCEGPYIGSYSKTVVFIARTENFHVEDYVRDKYDVPILKRNSFRYNYIPDYAIVALILVGYANSINNKNTDKLLSGKKVITDKKLEKEMENMNKIADEILSRVEKDLKENSYMDKDFLNVFTFIRDIKKKIRYMTGCTIMSIGDFFMSGGQLRNR